MTPLDLFNEALERADPVERKRFLDDACGMDLALRHRVERLLQAHGEAGSFLSITGSPLSISDTIFAETAPAAEAPGDRIGPYRLLEQIGEGGCGVVYMAEQEQPMRRKVALKIVKLGMDTREVLARFEAERQVLALMDHPNIASVFDGGATESGRPYFVMELVRGLPITEFCDARRMPPNERLELFRKVCLAVQHAHQKGIIHRDLKPSNILVTEQDDQPLPKVIDFGVAKALRTQLTEKTLFTRFGQWIGTPAYMSPEQAGLGGLDVDTRSDIYSLGTILYELLTGRTPFDERKLREQGYEAILRALREEDPPKASTRLTSLARAELTSVAMARGKTPEKLGEAIKGELDWILIKALERDRTRRYESANALAKDLERYCHGETISAVPPSLAYKMGKLARKHWKVASVAAAFAVLTIATAITSTVLAVQKDKAAARAMRAEGVAEQQKETALRQRDSSFTNYYIASMHQAWRDWEKGIVNQTADTVMKFLPRGDTLDPRGWEWFYLASLLEDDESVLRPELGSIGGVAFSPDGTMLAVAGEEVAIYERQGMRLIRSLPGHAPIAWRPEHRQQLATVTKGGVTLWDVPSGDVLRRADCGMINSMSWRKDGGALALAGVRGFGIWEEGSDLLEIPSPPGPVNSGILSIAWSPDGRLVAMGFGFPAQILVWNTESRSFLKAIDVSAGSNVLHMDWSAANGHLAHGNHAGWLYCWDMVTESKLFAVRVHGGISSAVAWSPDGTWLATGGYDHLVKIWEPAKQGSLTCQFPGHRAPVRSLAWSPDGTSIASASHDGSVRLWKIDRDPAGMLLHGGSSVAWSPDGNRVATQRIEKSPDGKAYEGSLLIYHARTGALERELGPLHRGGAKLAWSPDGRLLGAALLGHDPGFRPNASRSGGGLERARLLPGEAQVWDLESGRLVHRLTDIHLRDGDTRVGECRSLAWSPDGKAFATCGHDKRVKIWDTASAKLLHTLEGHRETVGTVRWSPDGQWFLSADWNRHVRIWDAGSWECLWDLPETGPKAAEGTQAADWSPDSRRFATRISWGDLVVWELAENQPARCVWRVRAHSSNIRSVDWSPDGKRIATSSEDGMVKVWDAASGREMISFDHLGWVQTVAWSPDGTRLAASQATRGRYHILIRDASKARAIKWEDRLKAGGQVPER